MDNSIISLIIAGLALLVSIITGAYQIYRSKKESVLKREVTKSSLLTELFHTVLNAQMHRISSEKLLDEAINKQATEIIPALENLRLQLQENEKTSLETYKALLFNNKVDSISLETIRHYIELMNITSEESFAFYSIYYEKLRNKS